MLISLKSGRVQKSLKVLENKQWVIEKVLNFIIKRGAATNADKKCEKEKIITLANMNQNIKVMEYAVRGPLLIRASEIEKELASGVKKPFKQVIKANLGDCHAMGQKPITYFRQVLALVCYPELFNYGKFPSDTVERAKLLLENCRGQSVGSYSESYGIEIVRKHVAESITKRDGYPSCWQDILLSAGASDSIKSLLRLINQEINGKKTGILVPIPQYPLYSASLAEYGMILVGYYLNEKKCWGLDLEDLNEVYHENKEKCNLKAIVLINPGNPTGQVLTKENLIGIVKFAYKNRLVLLADEVYQTNVYDENSEFHSVKKIISEMGEPYCNMELASFMSCSKGYMGECGIRGAYCEIVNFDEEVMLNFSKSVSASLCPTTLGQCLLDCTVKPPEKGDPSFELYESEKNTILCDLKKKAEMVYEFFNSVKGFSCNKVQGAMYAFPSIDIPKKAVEEATKKNLNPDSFYAFQLLENTGICVVPGSGFKQSPGTYHFRTTILPPVSQLKEMLDTFRKFHLEFMSKYS